MLIRHCYTFCFCERTFGLSAEFQHPTHFVPLHAVYKYLYDIASYQVFHCALLMTLRIVHPVHPHNAALAGPYVPVRVTRGALARPSGSGRTSVHLCATSLQNLVVQQDFYFPLGVPLERSC